MLAVLALFIAVHLALNHLSEPEFSWWALALAFVPARYSGHVADIPGGEIAGVTSFLTHQVVHIDVIHLMFNSLWFLAFAAVLCKRMGGLRFILFSAACGCAGAALFLLFHLGTVVPVVGASGAIAGMMGGVMRFLFTAIDSGDGWALRNDPASIPRMSLSEALRDRRIVIASLAFVGLNLLALVGFGSFGANGAIAWEAHLGGYFFGLLAFGLFDPAPQKTSPISIEIR